MSGHQDLTLHDVYLYEAMAESARLKHAAEIARLTRELDEARAALVIARTTAANLHDVIRLRDRELEEARGRERRLREGLERLARVGEGHAGNTDVDHLLYSLTTLIPAWARRALATLQEASES